MRVKRVEMRVILEKMESKVKSQKSKPISASFKLIILIVFVFLLSGCGVRESSVENGGSDGRVSRELGKIMLGERELEVEIVDESGEIAKGLGYRDEIGSEGMLFVMPRRASYTFWMKGMRMGLDMVWIDSR